MPGRGTRRQPLCCTADRQPPTPSAARRPSLSPLTPLATAAESTPLLTAVELEARKVRVNLFCPGHKQGAAAATSLQRLVGDAALRHDVPELPALDNLFAPDGAIAEAQARATDAFLGADAAARGWHTFFLVNGSTCGVEAAVLATVRPGRAVILPRNAHQSAVHALVLSGGVPVWVEPAYDATRDVLHGIEPAAVAAALAAHEGEVDAVLIVSPTYHGVCSDVAAISALAHAAGACLIVDEAHGAHFAFHPGLPTPAAACGADAVVQSTHKTLGALTQAAMLHVQSSPRMLPPRVSASLQLVQSTSPSYLLMSSLDAARALMAQDGRALLASAIALARNASTRIATLEGFSVLTMAKDTSAAGLFALDPTRVTVLLPETMSGYDLDEHLIDTFGIYAELPAFRHITFIFTPGNSQADVDTLVTSLAVFAVTAKETPRQAMPASPPSMSTTAVSVLSPRDAFFAETETVTAVNAVGRVSADTLCPYPPGIPMLIPGEEISAECIDYLHAVLAAGGSVSGAQDDSLSELRVVKN